MKSLTLVLLVVPLLMGPSPPSALRVDAAAQGALRELWAASVAAKAERVACLASEVSGDTLRITRVRPLPSGADAQGVSARASLEECGPPEWQGTVHTHISLDGQHRPSAIFSGSDRGVMLMWWQRWKSDGTFCLLYSDHDAHCEIDGAGLVILPSAKY